MVVNHVAHLCGYFSVKNQDSVCVLSEFWENITFTEEAKAQERQYYYPEFVHLNTDEVTMYKHVYDRDMQVVLRDGRNHTLHLDSMNLYYYPFGIVMFSIDINQKGVELSDALQAVASMRNITAPDFANIPEYEQLVLAPLKEACQAAGNPGEAASLMECGNKLKIFQSVVCNDQGVKEEDLYHILFGAGTLAVYDENDPMSFSRDYYDSIMDSSKLSVFKNWKALALLDTFSIAAESVREYMPMVWSEDYFRKIFLYALYTKFFLFRVNLDFREGKRKIKDIQKDLDTFEARYAFPKISYNFLPVEFCKAMFVGLDIEEERTKITEKVTEEKDRREAEAGDKMNLFLGIMTCLTLFSAIWDFSCLMDGLFVFGDTIGTVTGFRACTMAILSIICLSALIIRKSNK